RRRPDPQEGPPETVRVADEAPRRIRRRDRCDAGRRSGDGGKRPRPSAHTRGRAGHRMSEDGVTPAHGFTLITGLSGAGRSERAPSLEDLGYFVVDNLPPALLPKMAELTTRPGSPTRVAIVVDARGGVYFSELSEALEELRALERDAKIVFLEASDDD